MDLRADLHLHTTASDGRWPPQQLVAEVQQAGIGLFAVTDHDSLDSLAEAGRLAHAGGLRFLPGVELSSRLNGQLYHLLIYGLDPGNADLAAFVAANNARLMDAGDAAIRLLIEAGHPISWTDYRAYTWDRRRGGWKAFNYALDRGLCHSPREFFDGLFANLPYPQPHFPSPEEVIAAARPAGGIVVLAHPGAFFYNGLDMEHLDQLVEMGIKGVECYSVHHDEALTRELLVYCRKRDLLVTGGSDCHGGFVGRPLGLPLVHMSDLRLGVLEEKILD